MSPEVLIYIQTVKNYFEKNEDARKYFLTDVKEDEFFHHLGEISQKNYEKEGEAMLTQAQLELLRRTLLAKGIAENDYVEKEIDPEENLYINTRGFGRIYLN